MENIGAYLVEMIAAIFAYIGMHPGRSVAIIAFVAGVAITHIIITEKSVKEEGK
jgi:Kef-type K+ transport system membrane component KefB